MALYNHVILAMHIIWNECWMCELKLSNAQTAHHCHNELGNTLMLAHITTGECVVHYITSLFQQVVRS